MNYILTDALENRIPELLVQKGFLLKSKNHYPVFGFNVTETEQTSEMMFNPFLKLIFMLKTDHSSLNNIRRNPVHPYGEMRILFSEGLYQSTYNHLLSNASFAEQINRAKIVHLQSLLKQGAVQNMNKWISLYE